MVDLMSLDPSHGVISLINVPVMIEGRTWGVLEVDSERKQSFDQWDVDFLSTLANMLGSALARQTAEERAIESAAQKTGSSSFGNNAP